MYFQQTRNNSCGAAALIIFLKHYNIDCSEDDLYIALNIKKKGTCQKELRELLFNMGLHFDEFCQGCLHPDSKKLIRNNLVTLTNNPLYKLQYYLDKGKPVLLNILSKRGTGHFVVATSYDETNIIVNDPDPKKLGGGRNIKISKKSLEKRWVSGNRYWHKWMLV